MEYWKNLSLSKKLYAVMSIMGFAIVLELLTLIFAMNTLSALRGYVGGEGQWSKGQKDAVIALQNYVITHDERYYQIFLERIRVPLIDKVARDEMDRPDMDYLKASRNMQEGLIHPEDVPGMIRLYRRFSSFDYFQRSVEKWKEGDEQIERLVNVAKSISEDIKRNPQINSEVVRKRIRTISDLNASLTNSEDIFSDSLGKASRWYERVLLTSLVLVIMTIMGIGYFLAVLFNRDVTKGFKELIDAAREVGKGNLDTAIPVRSRDELGELAESLNLMTENLKHQKSELKIRDEFLSLASHELKTPLTSLKLQIQMRKRRMEKESEHGESSEKLLRLLESEEMHINRLVKLIEDMLDISRIRKGKFVLNVDKVDLVSLTKNVIQMLDNQAAECNCSIEMEAPSQVIGEWDNYRLEQMMVNLFTNAMKYGNESKIICKIKESEKFVEFSVSDQGIGIEEDDKERIFEQFERAENSKIRSGLGLGLYIVKQIIVAHQGEIKVESEIGKGATFLIKLPRTSSEKETYSAPFSGSI